MATNDFVGIPFWVVVGKITGLRVSALKTQCLSVQSILFHLLVYLLSIFVQGIPGLVQVPGNFWTMLPWGVKGGKNSESGVG